MNQNNSPKVWYASEKRIKSITKFVVFDDSGTLEISDKAIKFIGPIHKITISKSDIRDISLVRQNINWIAYGAMNIIALIYIKSLGWDFDTTTLIYLIIANIWGLVIGLSTKWIAITYGENGIDKTAHFASADMAGWSGILGGTKKIYDSLKK